MSKASDDKSRNCSIFQIAEELRCNFCEASRRLVNNPGFTIGSVLILALAIGVNTLLFTFLNAYLLKPLPLKDPQRNFEITARKSDGRQFDVWSYADFLKFRGQSQAFEEVYAWSPVELRTREPSPRKLKGVLASSNLFRIFNARMVLGRTYSPQEDEMPGRDAVAVVSHHAWQSIFNQDPQVVGKSILIRQTTFTIIGVTGPDFTGTDPITMPDLWAPLVMRDQLVTRGGNLADPGNLWLKVAGLLKPDMALVQAEDSIHGTVMSLNTRRPPGEAIESIRLMPRATSVPLVGEVLAAVGFIFAALTLVLLIACTNLAGIVFARGAARQREIAIRAAMGASRGRLILQLLTESMLLSAIAAVPSLLFTKAGTNALQQYICTFLIQDGYYVPPVSPDWHVFLFTSALALATGITLGLAPALEATRANLADKLKAGSGTDASLRPRRFPELLLVSQVTASLVLLVVAGVFIRSAQRVSRVDPGFDVDHLIDVRSDGSKQRFIQRFKEDTRFEAASEVYRPPIGAHGLFRLPARVDDRGFALGYNYVDKGYFETVGLPVRRGRSFAGAEVGAGTPVVVVSEATARLLWPQEDPIGKTIDVLDAETCRGCMGRFAAGTREVIGVVPDVVSGLWSGSRDRTAIYLPAAPSDSRDTSILLRSRDSSSATIATLKKICAEVDGENGCEPIPLRETVARLRFPFVAAAGASSGVGAIALLITCIGLYGVVAYTVIQRTREIGIRIALGATPLRVLRSIMTQSMLRVALGMALGMPLCIGISKIAAAAFLAVETFDPVAYVATPLFLAAVTLTAAYIPARRATRVDPVAALRQEWH